MQAIYRAPMNYFVPAVMDAQPFDQDIANGREFDNPGWEISGFELMKHQSAVTDWSDEQQIQALHYLFSILPSVHEDLAMSHYGCG